MRHYIEDPDNEDRLLKIPFRVITAIKAEAYKEAIQAIKYEHGKYGPTVQKNTLWGIELAMHAIENLGEKPISLIREMMESRAEEGER